MPDREITLSVVSHRQNALVNQLLDDVQRVCADRVALVLTQNIADPVALATTGLSMPVDVVVNHRAIGFGANHNAAFLRCSTPYFCVCNPDIRLPADPFPALLAAFADARVAVAGPLVRSAAGGVEDSARRFPTAAGLFRKLFADHRKPDYPTGLGPLEVDWTAGMFMLFRSSAFRSIGGFDAAYFMYYEDVDLCLRLRRQGQAVIYQPQAQVVHEAQRGSRRDLRLARHHALSMLRFLLRG